MTGLNCRKKLILFIWIFVFSLTEQWPNVWPGKIFDKLENRHESPRLVRVLNFFPVPVEEECVSEDKRRRGLCMNNYECHIQRGKSDGSCALGFGVCCIFVTNCDEEVQNNITYVTSPGFPNLFEQSSNCTMFVKKIHQHVTQLRIDFLHFNIGQPNKKTGTCDEDFMEIRNNKTNFRICGWNSGQHVYLDLDENEDTPTVMDFHLSSKLQSRMWEIRVLQLDFQQRAPAGCLQYYQSYNGTLRTFNYFPNSGRYLANQNYLICIRQERQMCGISYVPCRNDSFRIGPSNFEFPTTNNTTLNSDNVNFDMGIEGSGMEIIENNINSVPVIGPMTTRQIQCRDRILIPCDFDEFISAGNNGGGGGGGGGSCNLEHCGHSLCHPNQLDSKGNCKIEIWSTPFRMRIDFGPGQDNESRIDENTGMCVIYEQLPCIL